MDPVSTTIINALIAGTAMGVTEVSKNVITEAYNRLITLIKQKFGNQGSVVSAISSLEQKPDSNARQAVLIEEIEETKVYEDVEILKASTVLEDALKSASLSAHHVQQATGNFIAQADRGSSAKVEIRRDTGGTVV